MFEGCQFFYAAFWGYSFVTHDSLSMHDTSYTLEKSHLAARSWGINDPPDSQWLIKKLQKMKGLGAL